MTNYTPLQKNTLDGLSETAGILYMDLCDKLKAHESRENERVAFLAACGFDMGAGGVFDYIMRNYPGFSDVDDGTKTKLARFCADRYRHNFV